MDDAVSKTQRKREMLALQDVGEKLVTLSSEKLQQLKLSEILFDAVSEAKELTKFGAIKRQLQYIGRLMRDIDSAPIIDQLETWDGKSIRHTTRLHFIERWRVRLLDEETSLAEFLNSYPAADAQRLRTLIRNIHTEQLADKPSKHFRSLFKEIDTSIPLDAKIG